MEIDNSDEGFETVLSKHQKKEQRRSEIFWTLYDYLVELRKTPPQEEWTYLKLNINTLATKLKVGNRQLIISTLEEIHEYQKEHPPLIIGFKINPQTNGRYTILYYEKPEKNTPSPPLLRPFSPPPVTLLVDPPSPLILDEAKRTEEGEIVIPKPVEREVLFDEAVWIILKSLRSYPELCPSFNFQSISTFPAGILADFGFERMPFNIKFIKEVLELVAKMDESTFNDIVKQSGKIEYLEVGTYVDHCIQFIEYYQLNNKSLGEIEEMSTAYMPFNRMLIHLAKNKLK